MLVPQWMESYHPEYLYFQCSFFSSAQALTLANHLDFHERHTGAALYRSIWEAASLDQAYTTK